MYTDEFRIGNFILDRNEEVEISGILRGGFYIANTDLKLRLNVGDRFSPIPLTKDWLIKFGFKPFQNDWTKKGIIVHSRKRGFIVRKSIPQLKYVHQLQNLYFALTGVELQLSST